MSSEPVIVFYKWANCGACKSLTRAWNEIEKQFRRVRPAVRIVIVESKERTGKFDVNQFPKNLIKLNTWYPMILLIPAPVWNNATRQLGANNNAELKDGTQIYNGFFNDQGTVQSLAPDLPYNMSKIEDYGKWLTDALNNEDFLRVQNGNRPNMLQNVRPIIDDTEQKLSVCSMRIISRPK